MSFIKVTKKRHKELLTEATFVRFDGYKYVKDRGRLVGLWKSQEVYV